MAWTTPRTWIGGETLTAALLNTHLRDNMLELDVAQITQEGDYVVAAGANDLVKRTYGFQRIDTSETKTASTYGALATVGPAVTLTTGTSALVFWKCQMDNAVTDAHCKMSYKISGATTSASDDTRSTLRDGLPGANALSFMGSDLRTDLVAGSNTFTAEYASDGTNTATFVNRVLFVISL